MSDCADDDVFEIRIRGSADCVKCRRSEKVLSVLEQAMFQPSRCPVRVGCRNGGCGLCRVRVLSGKYVTAKMSRDHVSHEEEAAGYALACRLFPGSDLEIESAFINRKERRSVPLSGKT